MRALRPRVRHYTGVPRSFPAFPPLLGDSGGGGHADAAGTIQRVGSLHSAGYSTWVFDETTARPPKGVAGGRWRGFAAAKASGCTPLSVGRRYL
eukprot:gene9933-biopygen13805